MSHILLKGKNSYSGLEGEGEGCGESCSQNLLLLWYRTKCDFFHYSSKLFIVFWGVDCGCLPGLLKIEGRYYWGFKTCFILFCFPLLSCSVTFQEGKWNKNAFILPLELGIQCHLSSVFLQFESYISSKPLLPMYVSLSIVVFSSNIHDLEKIFPTHLVIEIIFPIIQRTLEMATLMWCLPWFIRTDPLSSLSCI